MDRFSKEERSLLMGNIHGKDTRIENLVRKGLFSLGFRYRKNDKRYPGTPDIVLSNHRTVIFVNGCFWHGHEGCHLFHLPDKEYWKDKVAENRRRDERNVSKLLDQGFRVIIIWECAIRKKDDYVSLMLSLADEIRKGKNKLVVFPDDELRIKV